MKKEFKIGDRVEVTAISKRWYKLVKEKGTIVGFSERHPIVKIYSGNGFLDSIEEYGIYSDKYDLIYIQEELDHIIKHI